MPFSLYFRCFHHFYNKDNLPAEANRTWVTKTIAETDSDGTTHYITKLADAYKVSGDSFYMQDGKAVLPLGTLTVEETKAPNGYLLDGAYMQAGDKSEQIKGLYVTQITEDGDLAVLSGSNQFSVSDKVIRGGVKIQKRDLETGDTKPQGSATLKDTAFDIISLNDNAVLVEGKLYKKNEVVKTIRTDIEGIASTSSDLLPYGKFRIVESEAPDGYLTDGAKPIDFTITENGKIVDLTDKAHSIYNQIKRGDIEGVKIGAGTHKRLADVPFRITSKTTGENHVVVTDDNGQFSTSAEWASHKHNTNAGKTSEDGVWFGTSEPGDSKGALPYDTYIIEEMRCKENKGRYECGGYIYSGEGQELGQFWAKLNVGNAKLQKTSSNTSITDGNGNYSIAGATYGVFADKDCTKQLATLTTDENGNTDVAEVKAGTVYIKELSAPAGYKVDKTVYPLTIKAGETATLKVSDTPKVTDTLIELFKIDMETQKDNPQGNASLAGAEFTWKYYAGLRYLQPPCPASTRISGPASPFVVSA